MFYMMKSNRNKNYTLKGNTRLLVRTGDMNTISFYITAKQIREQTGNFMPFNGAMRKALWELETVKQYEGVSHLFYSAGYSFDINMSIV